MAAALVVPILGNPHPALGVEAECKRLADHRLGGEQARAESRRHRHHPDRLVGGEKFRRPRPLLGLLPVCRPGHSDLVSSCRDPAGNAEGHGTCGDEAQGISWRRAHESCVCVARMVTRADIGASAVVCWCHGDASQVPAASVSTKRTAFSWTTRPAGMVGSPAKRRVTIGIFAAPVASQRIRRDRLISGYVSVIRCRF